MKKFLSIALALLMVCVMLPIVALADDGEGNTLPSPVDGKITLTGNITTSSIIEIRNASVLDLNGFTISGKGTVLDVYGTLEITDSSNNHSGKITSTEITNNTNPNSNAVWVNPGANVTITGGTFTAKTWSVVVAGSGDAASLIVNGENVVIENGISGNGSAGGCTTTIDIKAGKISSNDVAIYHPQVGTLNVSGGTITGATGIEMRSGTLNVTGGTITATASEVSVTPNGNGSTTQGAAVAIAQHTTKNPITVNISGGALSGKAAINEADPQNNGDTTKTIAVSVTGGNLVGKVEKASQATISITGGTFTDKENAKKYIPEGKTINSNGTVVDKTITIIVPGDTTPAETPKTEDQKNPSTGATDFVGLAAAAAVVALLGSAVVLRKK